MSSRRFRVRAPSSTWAAIEAAARGSGSSASATVSQAILDYVMNGDYSALERWEVDPRSLSLTNGTHAHILGIAQLTGAKPTEVVRAALRSALPQHDLARIYSGDDTVPSCGPAIECDFDAAHLERLGTTPGKE